MALKKDFVWGTATASFQIEGAWNEDGKGVSIWDSFCRVPAKILEGHTGDIACDHYHRFREDVRLMKELGMRAYRFSISWPRIFPNGTGAANKAGLRFYEELVEELLSNGIEPYATLYHWDLPEALQRKGGWLNPESPLWFESYAEFIGRHFKGKIRHYFTINEPQCFIGLGYARGVHAPGWKLSASECLAAVHHVLLAHGRAVRALRNCAGDISIGLAQCGSIHAPATEKPQDIDAARKATLELPENVFDALFSVSLWSDPIFKGKYPTAYFQKFAANLPEIKPGDMELISQPLDFYAQNIYQAAPVAAAGDSFKEVYQEPGHSRTSIGWPIVPDSLYWASKFLYERYRKGILFSENGMAAHDAVSLDGAVHDPNRQDYLHRYLLGMKRAAEEGIPILGYFYWSFLDNFEWAYGYSERFGLVYVDYVQQKRIVKDSARWYRQVIETNGEIL